VADSEGVGLDIRGGECLRGVRWGDKWKGHEANASKRESSRGRRTRAGRPAGIVDPGSSRSKGFGGQPNLQCGKRGEREEL